MYLTKEVLKMEKKKQYYRNVAISCKAGELLDRIAEIASVNRGAFVAKLIEKEYENIVGSKQA
jgi:hypothetical protein